MAIGEDSSPAREPTALQRAPSSLEGAASNKYRAARGDGCRQAAMGDVGHIVASHEAAGEGATSGCGADKGLAISSLSIDDASADGGDDDEGDDYEESVVESDFGVSQEVLDNEPRSIILSMLSQVTKGMDLHKIAFPAFVLEPRSLLERVTDFMAHQTLLFSAQEREDKVERFLDVVRYFMSAWHIRPKGVKKPYNPVLGEFFRCRWPGKEGECPGFYIAEQVSHHPPISAYFYANPDRKIIAMGNFRPKSRFLGNSVVSIMKGSSHIFFTDRPGEEYCISNPNIYGRGILFGTMLMEIGDGASVTCEKSDLKAEIEFKTKGFFTGTYNSIYGTIREISTGRVLYELSGKWTDVMYIAAPGQEPTVFLDVRREPAVSKFVAPISKQDGEESRRLWRKVSEALIAGDYDRAAQEKAVVEDTQRSICKLRGEDNIQWRPKFFRRDSDDFWYFVDRKAVVEAPEALQGHLQKFLFQHYGLSSSSLAGYQKRP